MSLPATPLATSAHAVKEPERPDPMIQYFVVAGTGAFSLWSRYSHARVVRCQYDKHGLATGKDRYPFLVSAWLSLGLSVGSDVVVMSIA